MTDDGSNPIFMSIGFIKSPVALVFGHQNWNHGERKEHHDYQCADTVHRNIFNAQIYLALIVVCLYRSSRIPQGTQEINVRLFKVAGESAQFANLIVWKIFVHRVADVRRTSKRPQIVRKGATSTVEIFAWFADVAINRCHREPNCSVH